MNKDMLLKRVLFGGYYGMDNVGDDCFGFVSTWGARNYWKTKNVYLLSTKEIDGPIKTNPCLKKKYDYHRQILFDSFLEILRSTCVIWSGGSIFHSKASIFNPSYLSFITSKIGITPTGAIGVSLGPYRTIEDQKVVHAYLRCLRFLVLRDQPSYEEALSINLQYKPVLAADLAMLLPKIMPDFKSQKHHTKILGITVCHYERYVNRDLSNESRREKLLLDALITLLKFGYDGVFRFFIFNSNPINGDTDVTMEFCNKLINSGARIELVSYSTNPIAIWKQVAECTAMISTRLHGAIFAAAADVPCCLIEYHRKCTDFIMDIGVNEKWIIGDADLSSKIFADKLFDLLTSSPETFYSRRDHLVSMAEKNFTFII